MFKIHNHSLSEWVAVTRYWSFAVSAMPVIVTFAYLCSRGALPGGAFPIINFVISLIGAVTLHAAGNVLSDWADYRSGVDNSEAYAVPNLVFGKFAPREYLIFSIILFIIGAAAGIILVFRLGLPSNGFACTGGMQMLMVGGLGVLLTALYSPLKYHALGDIDIFIIFSVLIILGTSCAVCGSVQPDALVLALPIGIITVSVLHANNTVDIKSDGDAGIKTFAMLLGAKVSCRLYQVYMLIPFICIIASVAAGLLHPFTLISLAAAFPAYGNFRAAGRFNQMGIEAMKGLDQASAKLQMIFSGLLAISLFIVAVL